jgi:hypothetical protein
VREINEAWEAMPPNAIEALRFERARPRGLPASQMDAKQRQTLSQLVDVYVSRLANGATQMDVMKQQGSVDAVSFAWAGSDRRGEGHYYRVQGDWSRENGLLIEYDNTQDGANHVHAVLRDMKHDFGVDYLREHVRAAH